MPCFGAGCSRSALHAAAFPAAHWLIRKFVLSWACASKDVVITTRRRWAGQAGMAAPVWQVLESRTVGGRDIVVVGGSPR